MKPEGVHINRQLALLVVFGLSVLMAGVAFFALRSREVEKSDAAFQKAAQARFDDLQADLNLVAGKVDALGAYVEASYPSDRMSFQRFVSPLLSDADSSVQAYEWAPRVTAKDRAVFEQRVRDEGVLGFEIRDRAADGHLVRAGQREVYFPVLYVLPLEDNNVAQGIDDLARPNERHEAIDRAILSGGLTSSAAIRLASASGSSSCILFLRPVYRHRSGMFRHDELLGFAQGVLRLQDFVERRAAESGVELAVVDLSDPSGKMLYQGQGIERRSRYAVQYRTVTVGGRNWLLAAWPMVGAFPVMVTNAWIGAICALLFTLLIAGYTAIARDRRWQVEHVVEERTHELHAALASLAEAHRGLEASEARYRRFIEDCPQAIVVEREGQVYLVNRACLELLGVASRDEFATRGILEFVLPEYRTTEQQRLTRLRREIVSLAPQELRIRRCDGRVLDVETVASSSYFEGVFTVQIVLHDISQRKLDEATNMRLVRAIEQVGESIVITDMNFRIIYVNPAYERLSGYSRAEALGRNPEFLANNREPEELREQIHRVLRNGESWNGRLASRARSGRAFVEDVTISPISNRAGELINYIAVKRDVTLELELAEQLHQSQKMDAIGRLAGGVAHDFNNMLMVIVSYAELIAMALDDDHPARGYTTQILNAAQRSSSLTRQLLAFGRKQVLTPQVLDCNGLVLETSNMVRRLIAENIDLQVDLAPELWLIKADPDQIVQVIINLCVNARDAMPDGGTLTLATRNYQVDEGFVELSVADTGVGIAPEVQEKLFEPFFTTKQRGQGTGLGLATVYGIVQQSGGTVHVDSAPGHGATFRILLPRTKEVPAAGEAPELRAAPTNLARVMVVEDEEALRMAIEEQLTAQGYEVLTASNGTAALEQMQRIAPVSILVTDLIMPHMGGRELAKQALKFNPTLRVVFMSGYAERAHDEEDEPFQYLQKPFTLRQLSKRIAELNVS